MTDFDYEVKERKRLAGQARHVKHGSRSRKCSLSTDGMTEREINKHHGEVFCLKLNGPMRWSDFRPMSPDLQTEYLMNLKTTYGASMRDIADMMGINRNTLSKFLNDRRIGIVFQKGHSMSKSDRAAWDAFLGNDSKLVPETVSVKNEDSESLKQKNEDTDETRQDNHDVQDEVEEGPETTRYSEQKMFVQRFQLCFGGEIDIYSVLNSMITIAGSEKFHGTVEVSCTLSGD